MDRNYITLYYTLHGAFGLETYHDSDITEISLRKSSLVDIEFSDLEFMEKLGSGGSGTVSKGRWISKDKIVAIKLTALEEKEVHHHLCHVMDQLRDSDLL